MNEIVSLGWDAAWTPNGTGAWAVARGREVVLWEQTPKGSALLVRLDVLLSEWQPTLVAMDFPLAHGGVKGWRAADLETTRAFSRFGCPVHSPTPERPGVWGNELMEVMGSHGFEIGVGFPLPGRAVVEVYPHTVLLELYRSAFRIPYKAGRSAGYWPERSLADRKVKILEIHEELFDRLREEFDAPALPVMPSRPTLARLKQQEDMLDALVCLCAARRVLEGRFVPLGDSTAAIWNPSSLQVAESVAHWEHGNMSPDRPA